jgi:hypothetical protein
MNNNISPTLCICGHEQNRHRDIGMFSGWGQGECELCRCSFYEPKYKEFSYNKECRNPKIRLDENFNHVCMRCGKTVDKSYTIENKK